MRWPGGHRGAGTPKGVGCFGSADRRATPAPPCLGHKGEKSRQQRARLLGNIAAALFPGGTPREHRRSACGCLGQVAPPVHGGQNSSWPATCVVQPIRAPHTNWTERRGPDSVLNVGTYFPVSGPLSNK